MFLGHAVNFAQIVEFLASRTPWFSKDGSGVAVFVRYTHALLHCD